MGKTQEICSRQLLKSETFSSSDENTDKPVEDVDEVDGCALVSPSRQIFNTKIIKDNMIPERSRVVFDWDNTLKVINRKEKRIVSRVSKMFLQALKDQKKCELFIISAIRPSQMNIDTLLLEVDKLCLTDMFCSKENRTVLGKHKEVRKDYHWIQAGNIIICGYDKAEVFKSVVEMEGSDVSDRPVIFFDDEEVNIVNFSNSVENSRCYKID